MGSIAIKSTFLISLMGLQGCDFLWNFFEPQFNVKEEDYIPGVVDGDPEPPYATPQMSKSTLLGIDKDNDGVRDDIEIWINRNIGEPDIRKYLKLYVKKQNPFINCEGKTDCLSAYRNHRMSSECLGIILYGDEKLKLEKIHKLRKIVNIYYYNTRARKNHDAKMSKYLAATSWGSADHLGRYMLRDKFCEFEVKWSEEKLKDIWSYTNRAIFVRNVKEGLYEKYFDLHVNISDYPNICDEFSGPEENLCD